jgi:hypothetical protein
VGVPDGRGEDEGGVADGGVGVTPDGGVGVGRTNGDPLSVDVVVPDVASAAAGTALAEVEPGQGSVRNEPRASDVVPLPQRATTRKR